MFESLSTFQHFYFALAAIFILMLVYEKQLIALEDKFDAWRAARKATNKHSHNIKKGR